ncbi:GNAT family N-acetyltransferase [Dyadobacter luticola]|uniref:GNAT family N-acetyltransferase n=1 Tax=Dyadobacter luticola TaxID=1979387 RepID=A0A5R9KQ89_9BACT|nr:GNAT family N-acetyltransferase [Dyadobacter luticola]TLU98256.1 GNAT family N-acetyltransferase [Dyadobacter luticola]
MITTIRTDSNNPDFKQLTDELDQELCRLYNTKLEDYEEYNRITNLETVVLAYADDKLAGCGCFRKYDDFTVELKRMYVVPEFRQKGVAQMMVKTLEDWALELGNEAVILETGYRQPEAIAMYRKLGYTEIENYNGDTTIHSVSLRKALI